MSDTLIRGGESAQGIGPTGTLPSEAWQSPLRPIRDPAQAARRSWPRTAVRGHHHRGRSGDACRPRRRDRQRPLPLGELCSGNQLSGERSPQVATRAAIAGPWTAHGRVRIPARTGHPRETRSRGREGRGDQFQPVWAGLAVDQRGVAGRAGWSKSGTASCASGLSWRSVQYEYEQIPRRHRRTVSAQLAAMAVGVSEAIIRKWASLGWFTSLQPSRSRRI